jgi:dTDP-N-acetylfucosamine:lipid II N-acetylfucosaminyltransferase
MKVHLFASENLYTFAYLRFLEENFDISSSVFVFRRNIGLSFDYPVSVKERIISARSNLSFLKKVIPLLKRSEKFFFHQLPYGPSLFIWNLYPGLLAKATWIIWGGDVYIHREGRENFRKTVYEYLRRRMIRRIPLIASFIPGDFEIVRKVYDSKATYLQSAYPIPVDFMTREFKHDTTADKKEIRILVGNSGNESNNHIEILKILDFLKNADVRIVCPLSYSGNNEYISLVVTEGRKIFGEKFEPLMTILKTDHYLDLLAGIDIAVMNHERQQGLGNILPLMYFGKKVYLRSETTTYKFLKELGCTVYDIESDKDPENSFLTIDRHELIKNRKIITDLLSVERYKSLWTKILA